MSVVAEKVATARCFSSAAHEYDANARVQKRAAKTLLGMLNSQGGVCLDIGAGPGVNAAALSRHFDRVVALDLSLAMLGQCRKCDPLCGDMDALPLLNESVDAVFSNFAMQWSSDPEALFAEVARVLKPGGRAYLSIVSKGSLEEIERAWQAVDTKHHVNRFHDGARLNQWANQAGFRSVSLTSKPFVDEFGTPLAALKSIKAIGANNRTERETGKGLLGRKTLHRLLDSYPGRGGQYCVTYKVCFMELTK